MKTKLVFWIVASLFLNVQAAYPQQFKLEWETQGWASFVGDMDGDGVGEFAVPWGDTTKFYDGATHSLKWIVTGRHFVYYWFQSDRNPYLLHPSIDYNRDGVREILCSPEELGDYHKIMIVDIVNNTNIFELSDPQAEYDVEGLADVDGDNELELVIDHYGTTLVYSTGIPVPLTSVEGKSESRFRNFSLRQNYPNPLNPETIIEFSVRKPGRVEIRIFNQLGQIVRTLVDGSKFPGDYSIKWDGKDDAGTQVATGTYFYQLKADEFVSSKKMLLVR